MKQLTIFSLLLCAFQFLPAQIKHTSDKGFGFAIEADFPQHPPEAVFDAIIKDVSQWWNAQHTYTLDTKNLRIRTGRDAGLWEKLPGEGWVCHMRMLFLQRPMMIRFEGGLGPLQGLPVSGVMDWKIEKDKEGGSRLTLTYEVAGANGGLENWAKPVYGVLQGQVNGLKAYLEE